MKEAKALLEKYKAGICSEDELRLIDKWLLELHAGEAAGLSDDDFERLGAEVWSRVLTARGQVKGQESGTGSEVLETRGKVRRLPPYIRIAGVAAAVAAIVFGVWFYKVASQARNDGPTRDGGMMVNDVAPGKYGATITLANGQVIQLDSAKKGVIVGPELKYDDGSSLRTGEAARQSPDEIASEAAQPRNDGKESDDDDLNPSLRGGTTKQSLAMLTATTAKGQTYSFTLPDGTKVWLNADSKLEFPAQFSGKERRILMQGEAYFVVKHNDKQPFRVVSKTRDGKAQVVEDIGTEFNINAYTDERSVRTTLVEGAASVSPLLSTGGKAVLETPNKSGVLLTPDKQAAFSDGKLIVKSVDAIAAVSWKAGVFTYSATPLEEVMRQVARWYNVEVVFEKESLKKAVLGGAAKRSDQLSVILKTLESTGIVKFEIEGRKVTVRDY